MGNREENIARALKEMKKEGLEILKISSLIETAPYGRTDQNSFINGVCIVETSCTPEELLEYLLSIEKRLGRVRMEHWGPRSIDLDILFYEDNIIESSPPIASFFCLTTWVSYWEYFIVVVAANIG